MLRWCGTFAYSLQDGCAPAAREPQYPNIATIFETHERRVRIAPPLVLSSSSVAVLERRRSCSRPAVASYCARLLSFEASAPPPSARRVALIAALTSCHVVGACQGSKKSHLAITSSANDRSVSSVRNNAPIKAETRLDTRYFETSEMRSVFAHNHVACCDQQRDFDVQTTRSRPRE